MTVEPIIPLELRGPDFNEQRGSKEDSMRISEILHEKLWTRKVRYAEITKALVQSKKEGKPQDPKLLAEMETIVMHMGDVISDTLEENGFVLKPERLVYFTCFFISGDDDFKKRFQEE